MSHYNTGNITYNRCYYYVSVCVYMKWIVKMFVTVKQYLESCYSKTPYNFDNYFYAKQSLTTIYMSY